MTREEILKEIRNDLERCTKKQFSKNPYYILLRFFGASWWWNIRTLTEMEEKFALESNKEEVKEE